MLRNNNLLIKNLVRQLKKIVFYLKGFRLAQSQDTYPWTNCNAFESTKKNCPRGEACLKLKGYENYAWNWAMRCKFDFSL